MELSTDNDPKCLRARERVDELLLLVSVHRETLRNTEAELRIAQAEYALTRSNAQARAMADLRTST